MIEQSVSPHLQNVIVSAQKFIPDLDEEEAKRQARLFKALSDPTRLRILSLLNEHAGVMTVTDLVSCFKLAQPSLSHHLTVLRSAGLIDCSKNSTWNYYFVKQNRVLEATSALKSLEAGEQAE